MTTWGCRGSSRSRANFARRNRRFLRAARPFSLITRATLLAHVKALCAELGMDARTAVRAAAAVMHGRDLDPSCSSAFAVAGAGRPIHA